MKNIIKDFFIRLRNDVANQNSELVWATVWHDTIKGITWANSIERLSPGRAAAGYNYLYVMTRILDEIEPKKILDLGLGISSTLITSYIDTIHRENTKHLIIEHDKTWIDFYTNKHTLSKNTSVLQLDIEKIKDSKELEMNILGFDVY